MRWSEQKYVLCGILFPDRRLKTASTPGIFFHAGAGKQKGDRKKKMQGERAFRGLNEYQANAAKHQKA